jgi:signal transduction histidine kinase
MGAAAAALHHADPTGPVVGLFLVTAFAPLRLRTRPAAVVTLLSLLLFGAVLVVDQARPAVAVAVVSVGAAFFFLFGLLLRREREQRLRVGALLTELEASRKAEQESAALAERTRVAREIHDVLAHTLSGLVVQLDGARLMADRNGSEPALREVITRSHELARDGLVEARQAVSALRGTSVPGPELLPELVEEHRRLSGGACRLTVEGTPPRLDADIRLGVYRVAQEALSNVRKHAPGARVDVQLVWGEDDVVLEVVDQDGCGDPFPSHGLGAGLSGMRERAELAGGILEAGPVDGGFRVMLRMPLRGTEGR